MIWTLAVEMQKGKTRKKLIIINIEIIKVNNQLKYDIFKFYKYKRNVRTLNLLRTTLQE